MTEPGRHTISRRSFLTGMAASMPLAAMAAACGSSSSSASGGVGSAKDWTFSNWWGPQFAHYLPEMQRLTGVKVTAQNNSTQTQFFTRLASGTSPTFMLANSQWNGSLLPVANKYLAPFDEALKREHVDMSKWDVPPYSEEGYGGKTWGLSLFVAQDVICFVNKHMAEKDGLLKDLPVWGSPTFDTWKWPRYVEWLQAGTKRTRSGKVEQYGLSLDWSTTASGLFAPVLASFGGALVTDQWTYNGKKSLFASDPCIETVQAIADLYTKYKCVAPLGSETATPGGTYLAQKTVSTVGWSTPSIFPVQGNFPMEYFHLPYNDKRVHCHGANALVVNKRAADPEKVLDWVITFCTNASIRRKFFEFSSLPAYDPLTITKEAPAGDAKTIALINLSRIKGMSTIPSHTKDVVSYPYWDGGRYAPAATQTAVTSVVQKVILGHSTAKQACVEAAQQIDSAIQAAAAKS